MCLFVSSYVSVPVTHFLACTHSVSFTNIPLKYSHFSHFPLAVHTTLMLFLSLQTKVSSFSCSVQLHIRFSLMHRSLTPTHTFPPSNIHAAISKECKFSWVGFTKAHPSSHTHDYSQNIFYGTSASLEQVVCRGRWGEGGWLVG